MKLNKKRKLIFVLFVLFVSIFMLTGCGSSGSSDSPAEEIVQEQGYGTVEGYIYKTSTEEYTFNQTESSGVPVEGAQIEIDGTIYKTNTEGYFKSSKLRAGVNYGVNVIVENETKENFVWSKTVKVAKNETISLNDISVEKNWNVILFISDKSSSLKSTVDYFLNTVSYSNDLNNLNFFIIHGEYLDGKETNKAYYLTASGKEVVKDYGSVSFNDPLFMREEIQKINKEYPSKKTMVSVLSHGNGWYASENPGTAPNWLISDQAHYDGETVNALDSFELYEVFNNIGFDIDIFNYSACHMGQIEVISSLPEEVKYAMASPSFGYTEDMNVHVDLMRDINNGIVDSETLGRRYIDHYINNLNNDYSSDKPSVKALYDLNNMNSFISSFSLLTDKLVTFFNNNPDKILKFRNDILNSNTIIQSYYTEGDSVGDNPTQVAEKDLLGLLNYLKGGYFDYGTEIVDQAAESYDILNQMIVYSNNSQGSETTIVYKNVSENKEEFTYNNSNGLSITLKNDVEYQNTWFNQKTDWFTVLDQVN